MARLTSSQAEVALTLACVLCAGQAMAQSRPAPASAPAAAPFAGADANMMRYWQDPNQLVLKDSLGATDEEWKVIKPKIDHVRQLLPRGGARFGGMSPGAGARSASIAQTELAKATESLAALLDSKDTPTAEFRTALQAYRDAKAKVKAELERAQKELRELLTARQEGILKQMGLFD